MNEFLLSLIEPYQTYSSFQIVLEIIAVILGIGSVYLSMKRNIWVFPVGLISTAIYVYILFVFGLLGDAMINVYYSIMSIYGWILWSKNTEDQVHVEVAWAKKKDWFMAGILFGLSLLLVTFIYYFKPWIDHGFSMQEIRLGWYHLDWANWLDIFVTAIFLVGMWFMAKRRIENWIFWIIGDLVCIPMFIYKGLVITSIQYFIFTILAIFAYFEWKNQYAKTVKNEGIQSNQSS